VGVVAMTKKGHYLVEGRRLKGHHFFGGKKVTLSVTPPGDTHLIDAADKS